MADKQEAAVTPERKAEALRMFISLLTAVHSLTPDALDWVLRGLRQDEPPRRDLYLGDNWRERMAVYDNMESAMDFLEWIYNNISVDDPVFHRVNEALEWLVAWANDLASAPAVVIPGRHRVRGVPEASDSSAAPKPPTSSSAIAGKATSYPQPDGSTVIVVHLP